MGNIVDTNGMDKFNRDLDNNIKRLERLNNTADKTAESFNRLSEAYNRLQNQASESIKFKIPKNNTNKSNSNTSKSTSNRNDNNSNNQNRSKNKTEDKYKNIKKSIRDFDNVYKITNDLGRSIKSANISGVATSASKALGLMSSGITAAVASTGIITAAIVLLSKVTLDAHKNTVAYARALQSMGIELSNFEKNNIETSNQMRDLGNRIDNVGQAIGEKLYPALGMILDIVDFITGGISSEESKKNIALAQSNISTSAQQSGFDLSSANNLAGNTYKIAQQIADTTSEQASEVATKLADAWLNGTDAAKEYGVVVNDQVLTGYMASQGIDIANVQITEAMKQYYRYQLMMEQLNASSSDAMQDMIKEWTELGFIIDKTKGKLFSFDEVIQLAAADPTIPTVDGDGIYKPGGLIDETPGKTPLPNISNTNDSLNDAKDAVVANTNALDANTEALTNNSLVVGINTSALEANTTALNNNTNSNNISTSPKYEELIIAASLIDQAADKLTDASRGLFNVVTSSISNIKQSITNSANSAATHIESVTNAGIQAVSDTASQQVNNIINISDYMVSNINNQATLGQMAVGQTTMSGISQVQNVTQVGTNIIGAYTNAGVAGINNTVQAGGKLLNNITMSGVTNISNATKSGVNNVGNATKSGVKNISNATKSGVKNISNATKSGASYLNNTGKSNITSINSAGNSWLSRLSSLGNSLLAKLGSKVRVSSSSKSSSSKSSSSKSSSSKSSSSKSSIVGNPLNPFDLITEGSDLLTSIKDDNGKYDWNSLPSAGANMIISSVTNPIGAISTGYELGKEANGFTGGLTGAATNLIGYVGLETAGDLVNVAELAQDSIIGLWNKLTGDNVSSKDSVLSNFSNSIDSILNDMVNRTGSYAHFADGGIGTKEIHNATLFEGNKKEAVIPLETDAGIRYLSDAMIQAQGVAGQSLGGDIIINLTLSGVNIADNDAQWEKVGKKIAEVIDIQRMRRGELNYGSSF